MSNQKDTLGTAKISGAGDIELLDHGMRWFLPNCGIRRTRSIWNLFRPILIQFGKGDKRRSIELFSRSFVKDKDGRYELFFRRADDFRYLQMMAEQLGFAVSDITYGTSKPSKQQGTQLIECTLNVSLNGRSVTFDLSDKPNIQGCAHVDPYIIGQIEDNETAGRMYPFLMKVRDAFDESEILGLSVSSKLGNIWACTATAEAIETLRRDRRVVSLEGSRPGFWE